MGDDGSGSESGSKVGKLIKWKKQNMVVGARTPNE